MAKSNVQSMSVFLHVPDHTDGLADSDIGIIEIAEANEL